MINSINYGGEEQILLNKEFNINVGRVREIENRQ